MRIVDPYPDPPITIEKVTAVLEEFTGLPRAWSKRLANLLRNGADSWRDHRGHGEVFEELFLHVVGQAARWMDPTWRGRFLCAMVACYSGYALDGQLHDTMVVARITRPADLAAYMMIRFQQHVREHPMEEL